MIRKIALWTVSAIAFLVVAFALLSAYEMHRTPEVADTLKAVTGSHPDGYKLCLANMDVVSDDKDVSTDVEDSCRVAAQAGDPLAQFIMGRIAKHQAKQDSQKLKDAADWFDRAAKQNNYLAMYDLGIMYFKGDGVSVDYVRATNLFIPPAKRKNPGAQIMLAQIYADGKGTAQDYVQAVAWLTVALDEGRLRGDNLDSVRKFRDRLTAAMTPEQQARAKEMASQF